MRAGTGFEAEPCVVEVVKPRTGKGASCAGSFLMMPDAAPVPDKAAFLESIVADPAVGARRRNLSAGETVHEPDSPPGAIYFIHDGQVRIYQLAETGLVRLSEVLG